MCVCVACECTVPIHCRYCYYNETQNILGNTYGMAVLQDFEALTPNLLARTVETVEGGGLVIMLLSNLNSLTQLYSLTMDVHGRLRTESHQVCVCVCVCMCVCVCTYLQVQHAHEGTHSRAVLVHMLECVSS